MILGGVFDRHPELKLVLTEQWMDWATQVDRRHGRALPRARQRPSCARRSRSRRRSTSVENCYFGASFLSNWEAKLGVEHDLVANTMWGDDYPHAEGTWPHTREAMRHTFSDIDPMHTRQYLGDIAIDVYGLDRAELAEVADRIGPTVAEVATPYTPPEDEAVGLYAFRTGPGIFA